MPESVTPSQNDVVPASNPDAGSPLDDPTSARFQALLRDPRLFIREQAPYTAAIWTALLKPTSEIIANARRIRAEQPPSSDEPGEEVSPDDPLAIITLGEAMVASALMGDAKAQTTIAERIEGKVGLRKGDEDPDAGRRANETQGMMLEILRVMAGKARGDDAKTIDVKPVDGSGS